MGATATAGEETAAENEPKEEVVLGHAAPQAVSVLSKEQAMQLLKSDHQEQVAATRKRSRSNSKDATTTTPSQANAKGSSLEGKFVDLADLLLPLPSKGEFDVNKIKSSLYFFS